MAINVTGGIFDAGTSIELWTPNGGASQQWTVDNDGEWTYLVCDNNKALSCYESGIVLEEYTKAENQRWVIKQH